MLKVPLEWLKELVPIRLSTEKLAHELTMAGFEVTGIEDVEGQPVFSLEITPNRADCLSILGMAREVAAITRQRIKRPIGAWGVGRGKRVFSHPSPLTPHPSIRIEDKKGCAAYIGRLIEGVRIAPSPEWMQQRLRACGLRAINNIVDITNYVLLECGQPLHAFDADRLAQLTIVVRRARAGESLITIDGEQKKLTPEMLVIADANVPVAVAGVMGGRGSEVRDATTRILLESAWFEPVLVRRTGRALGLASESSYRFERGVDLGGVAWASARAASLIIELAGGVERATVIAGQPTPKRVIIGVAPARIARVLGASVTLPAAKAALQRIGCRVQTSRRRVGSGSRRGADQATRAAWRVEAPSFRRDLRQDVDVLEEIARIIGYERLPERLPTSDTYRVPKGQVAGNLSLWNPVRQYGSYERTHALKQLCQGLGLTEAMTWALVSEPQLKRAAWPAPAVPLRNPLSLDHAWLRPTLLIGLLQAAARNIGQGVDAIRLFEIGATFEPGTPLREIPTLGLLLTGTWEQTWQRNTPPDLYRAKGVLETVLRRMWRVTPTAETVALPWAEVGQSMALSVDGKQIGVIGQVSRHVAEAFDIKPTTWFGSLSLASLLEREPGLVRVQAPPTTPPVKRDLSFLIDRQVPHASVLELIRSVGAPLAGRVVLIDRFSGAKIPANQHSLTFSIDYRDPQRTLTAEEVEAVHARIRQALVDQLRAQLR